MPIDNNQNPFIPQVGKVVNKVERFQTESGQLVEIRWVETSMQKDGVLKKDAYFEGVPPLRDNRIPDSVSDIRECICGGLYHKDNVLRCSVCGKYFGLCCREAIKTDQGEVSVCLLCAKEYNRSLLSKIWKKFWTLED